MSDHTKGVYLYFPTHPQPPLFVGGWTPKLCQTVGYCRSTNFSQKNRALEKNLWVVLKSWLIGGGGAPCLITRWKTREKKSKSITKAIRAGNERDIKMAFTTNPEKSFSKEVVYSLAWRGRDWPAVGADVLSAPGAGAHVPPLLETVVARATFTQSVGPVAGHLHSPLLLQCWL